MPPSSPNDQGRPNEPGRGTASLPRSGARCDVALVCANGHLLNDRAASDPGLNAKFCPDCGEGTLSACPECDTPIRGRLHAARPAPGDHKSGPPGTGDSGPESAWGSCLGRPLPPRYCHECGEPFPWTAERLRAAEQLDDLSEEERRLLKAGFRDIVTDNPRTEVAALQVKQVAEGAGRTAGRVLLEVVEQLATETARRLIFGA